MMRGVGFLQGTSFLLAKDNRSGADLKAQESYIKRAGGAVTTGRAEANFIVVCLPVGATSIVWQCLPMHKPARGALGHSLTLPELLYLVIHMARPRPQIVLPEYVNHWLDHGREPTGPDRVAWTVILKSPAVANASSAAAQPETGPSAAISAPPPPQVFAAFSPCTFYLARGCTQGLGWLIENMGGVIEDAVQSGLYVLVPGPEITGGPETQRIIDSLGPLHPSGRILDQRFVLDCFVHSSFQDFTDYTLEPSTPASPKPTIRALDTDAPTVAESRGHSPHLTAHSPPYRSEWATDVAPLNPSVHYGDTVQAVGGYCPEANIGSPPYRPSRSPSPISGLSGPGPSTMVQRKRRRNEDEHGGDDGDDGGQPMRVSMGAPAHW